MEELHELKRWLELGFEPQPIILSIIGKIDKLINKNMEKETENQNQKLGEWKNDPENYEAMAVPFATEKELEHATSAFFAEISALRKKYKITDVILTAKSTYLAGQPGPEVAEGIMIHQLGSGMVHPAMAAFTFSEIKKTTIKNLNKIADIKD